MQIDIQLGKFAKMVDTDANFRSDPLTFFRRLNEEEREGRVRRRGGGGEGRGEEVNTWRGMNGRGRSLTERDSIRCALGSLRCSGHSSGHHLVSLRE